MKTETACTTKTVEQLVRGIINEGCGVYTNDAGNGCGGPTYIDDLGELLESGDIDNYKVIHNELWDGRGTVIEMIKETLDAHGHDKNDTATGWILAEKVEWIDGCANNPYRHYILLWEV